MQHQSVYFAFALSLFYFYLVPVEGILCYQCNSIPGNQQYSENCASMDDQNASAHLSVDCNERPVGNQFSGGNAVLTNTNGSSGFSITSLLKANNSGLISPQGGIDWLCAKVNAVAGGQPVVGRSCLWALTQDMAGRCEDIDNDYTIGNITITKVVMCFCDSDNCNGANPRHSTDPLLNSLLIIFPLIGIHYKM